MFRSHAENDAGTNMHSSRITSALLGSLMDTAVLEESPEQVQLIRALRQIDSWAFDVFVVDRITVGSALTHVAKFIFHKRGLESRYGR
jgi:hypothetical protein